MIFFPLSFSLSSRGATPACLCRVLGHDEPVKAAVLLATRIYPWLYFRKAVEQRPQAPALPGVARP